MVKKMREEANQGEQFFYLTGSNVLDYAKRTINVRALKDDIARGVKNLSEDAYCSGYGSTRSSLSFFLVLSKLMNIQPSSARMTYKNYNYRLEVLTVDGYRLIFKGVSAGYYGEGSRGTHDILLALKFSKEQRAKVWKENEFLVRKVVRKK